MVPRTWLTRIQGRSDFAEQEEGSSPFKRRHFDENIWVRESQKFVQVGVYCFYIGQSLVYSIHHCFWYPTTLHVSSFHRRISMRISNREAHKQKKYKSSQILGLKRKNGKQTQFPPLGLSKFGQNLLLPKWRNLLVNVFLLCFRPFPENPRCELRAALWIVVTKYLYAEMANIQMGTGREIWIFSFTCFFLPFLVLLVK